MGNFIYRFGLRLITINQSYWLDETIQVLESTVPFSKVWQIPADFHPPLFHYLAYFWLKVSTREWWARLLPVSLGVLSIYLFYREIKEIRDKKIALLGSLLLATSGFHVYYAQEFRPYMLSCFLATASYWLFLRLIRNDKTDKTYKSWWVGVNLLGLYSLYYFPFVLISQFLVLVIFYRAKIITWLKNTAPSVVFFLPWLPMFFQQLQIGRGWAEQFRVWKEVVSVPLLKVFPLIFLKFWLGNISLDNSIIYGLIVLGSLGIFGFLVYRSWQKERKITQIILIFLLVPIFLAFVSSVFIPTIAPKRLLLVLPQFFLLVSLGINSLTKTGQKAMIVLVLIINLGSLSAYYFNPRFQREQWRQAVSWVENKAQNNSLVLFEFGEPFGSWEYYQTNKVEAKAGFKEGSNVWLNLSKLTANKNQIFLFQYLVEMSDPQRKVESWLVNHGYRLKQTRDFSGVGFVYEYVK